MFVQGADELLTTAEEASAQATDLLNRPQLVARDVEDAHELHWQVGCKGEIDSVMKYSDQRGISWTSPRTS